MRIVVSDLEIGGGALEQGAFYITPWANRWAESVPGGQEAKPITHPWVDYDSYKEGYELVENSSNHVLRALSTSLNQSLGEQNSMQDWHLLLGPWLTRLVTSIHEKIALLEKLDREGLLDVAVFYSPPAADNLCVFQSTSAFEACYLSDSFQHRLFNDVLESLFSSSGANLINTSHPSVSYESTQHRRRGIRPLTKDFNNQCKRSLSDLFALVAIKMFANDIVFVSPYISRNERKTIARGLKRIFIPDIPGFKLAEAGVPDKALRSQLLSTFEKCISNDLLPIARIITRCLPSCFLENYWENEKLAQNRLKGSFPKVVINGVADVDVGADALRFLILQCRRQGAHLITRQHGGVYGSSDFMAIENMQRKNADQFITWGWGEKEHNYSSGIGPEFCMDFSSRELTSTEKVIKKCLIVGVCFPKYFYHMFPSPQSGKFPEYMMAIQDLSAAISRLDFFVNFRKYYTDYEWDISPFLADVNISDPSKLPLYEDAGDATVIIVSYDSTVHLQLLQRGRPVILYFDARWYRVREEAKPFYSALAACGVLHETHTGVVEFLKEKEGELDEWWSSAPTRSAVIAYCRFFGGKDYLLPALQTSKFLDVK